MSDNLDPAIITLLETGQPDQAMVTVGQDLPQIVALGNRLASCGDYARSLVMARRAVAIGPDVAVTHYNLGLSLIDFDRLDEAARAFAEAAAIDPDVPSYWANLGACETKAGRIDDALVTLQQAVKRWPDDAQLHTNLASALFAANKIEDARGVAEKNLNRAPEDISLHNDYAQILLAAGDFKKGWREYEWGLHCEQRGPDRFIEKPRWTVETSEDAKLLVWREQGLGDEIRFASLYSDLLSQFSDVTIEADNRLIELFRRSFPTANFLPAYVKDASPYCATTPAGSLMAAFRRRAADFPKKRQGYLVPDAVRSQEFSERLKSFGPPPYVGIYWTSGHLTTERKRRFSDISDWQDVLKRQDITIINMQYGDVSADLDWVKCNLGTTIHQVPGLDLKMDLDGVAALSRSLDAAVGSEGAGLELAAAVGCPVLQIRLAPVLQHIVLFPSNRRVYPRLWMMPVNDIVKAVNDDLSSLLSL